MTVLITGESGTGKELDCQMPHIEHSPRKSKPFIALKYGGDSQGFGEAELFGHEKAFADAITTRQGVLSRRMAALYFG